MSTEPKPKRRRWFRRATRPLTASPPGQTTGRAWESMRRWVRTVWAREDSPEPVALIEHRTSGADVAVVFVHGFGSAGLPFGRFPDVLAAESALEGWDLYSLGYSTSLMPDIRGFWESDPSIALLGRYLSTRARLKPLERYEGIALVAHSMGGLVVQQALLDDAELADRTSHLFMFGTPSNGVRVARWGSFLKQQIRDMAEGGPFIAELRRRWQERYGSHQPFDLWVIAGDRDRFVPSDSSLGPFPRQVQLVVPGDHLELVDVEDADSMSSQVVVDGLRGEAAPAGPWNAARVAAESSEHDRVIRALGPEAAELDEQHLISLALALEATGQRERAIETLTEHAFLHSTDAKGTLAGRIKRNWLDRGHRRDGEAALELYTEALAAAEGADDDEQIYYHAINVAFLELAFRRDHDDAAAAAERALAACGRAPTSYWRLATEAEAHLYLDRPEEALAAYREAIALEPTTRQLGSSFLQASRLVEALGRRDLRDELEATFRGGGERPLAAGAAEEAVR